MKTYALALFLLFSAVGSMGQSPDVKFIADTLVLTSGRSL